jgi:hypothetical protein
LFNSKSMNLVVYEDTPPSDKWLRMILAIPVVIILIAGIALVLSHEDEDAIYLPAVGIAVAVIFSAIIPRKYRILDDRVEVVLGGPLKFNIPFKTIKGTRNTTWKSVGINFPTTLNSKYGLQIVREKHMSVNITPSDRQAFIENLEKAMSNWSMYYKRTA